jgi:hypothetical protein
MHLANNQLTGSIPATLGNLTALQGLYASNNRLTGSIPVELCSLPNLGYIYLDNNLLTGSIPPELGSMPNLRQIFLYSNGLSGSIPPELGNATGLTWIVLRYNQLSGEIPVELGNLVNLQSLRLSHNQLSGEIPDTLGNLTELWEMLINANQLTGPIPTSLVNLTALTATNVGYNALYTSDEALITFLNTKDPDWAATQTIAPTGVTATSLDNAVILVSWLPVAYTANPGYYKVLISETLGGPYTLAGQTADKATSSVNVTGLTPGRRYYFVVQTHTNAHANNPNAVDSDYSTEASAVASAAVPGIAVTSPNGGESWATGSTHNVTWTQSGLSGSVTIDLYKGGVLIKTLGTAAATAGAFPWTIGAGETAGPDYRILVWQGSVLDQSNANFAIVRYPKRVDFNRDGQEDILWRYDGPGGYNRAWFLGDIGQSGIPLSAADMGVASAPKGRGSIGDRISKKYIGALLDMESISNPKDRPERNFAQDLMAGMNKQRDGEAAVNDPRLAGGRIPEGFLTRVADPRYVKVTVEAKTSSDLPAQVLSVPALLGGADVMPVADLSWKIVGTGDFDNDTHVDILWRNSAGGMNVVWFMNGTAWSASAELLRVADLTWQIVGTGDFNHDGHVDILWRNGSSGSNVVWYMNGTAWIGSAVLLGVSDLSWRIVGTGDFNGDGYVDILWRYSGAGGYNVVWYMNNATWMGSAELIPVGDPTWQIAGTGDYDNDGNIDILWRYTGAGGYVYIWYMNGVTWNGGGDLLPVNDLTWRIVSR